MGTVLIVLGLFLQFALGFNGSVGEPFVDFFFSASSILMIITGILRIANAKWTITRIFCLAALICYLPMIWQRFNFIPGSVSGGFVFDVIIILFLIVFIINKPSEIIENNT